MLGFINQFLNFFQGLGYPGIVVLMTIESSFVPFPSEIVIPPAAMLAQQGEMNIFLVIISGVIGSLFGAIINYILALYLGRAIVYRLADHKIFNLLLINSRKVKKAEDFFLRYGDISTLIGRLIPVVRQLISLPAGFVKMNFGRFIWFTFVGASIWVTILAVSGYFFGANLEVILKYYKEISLGITVLAIVIFIIRSARKRQAKNKEDIL